MSKPTTVKHLPNSRVQVEVKVVASEYRQAFTAELAEMGKSVQIAGFRPGKAPKERMLAHLGRPRVEAAALDRAIPISYRRVMEAEGLVPVAAPSIELLSYTAPAESAADQDEVASLKVEVDVMPTVQVQGYKKLKVKEPKVEPVTDEEVERVITYLRKQQGHLDEAVEGAKVEEGSWVEIGYEGRLNGVSRTDMTNQHHPLVVGEGQLIPGFEDQIIGLGKGESKTFPITFPKDYHATELAGKKAEFSVTVNDIRSLHLPELDETFAKQFGHATLAELEAAIGKDLAQEKEEQQKQQLEQAVIDSLIKLVPVELPRSLVEQENGRLLEEAKERLAKMKVDWEQYLAQTNQTNEQVQKELAEQAERNVRTGLILGAVMKEENIPDGEGALRKTMDHLISIAVS